MKREDATGWGAIAAAIVFGFTQAQAADATPRRSYSYHSFKERIPLDVEPSMIAVFDAPSVELQAAPGTAALISAGIAADRISPSSVPGWQYAELPEQMRSLSAVETLLEQFVRDAAYDFVSPVFIGTGGLPVVMTRDVLVGLRTDLPVSERGAFIAQRVPGKVLAADFAGLDGVFHVRTSLRSAGEVLDLVNELAVDPAVVFAQSDMIYWAERYATVPNDPLFPQQWALSQANDHDMNGPEAWDITTGDPSVVVVVLDSGIDQAHEDLNQIPGLGFTGSGTNGGPGGQCDNHGSAVAGCVAATIDNGVGVVGIAPTSTVRAGKIFNEVFFLFFCTPFLESQDSWTANGITWAQTSGARVTNSSWGGGTASAVITTAFNTTSANGIIHFGAAGNGGNNAISYPASLASVNAVAAINSAGNRASFSQFGTGLFISAPGEGILTTDRMGSAGYESGNFTTIDGTSFSSPYTAGVAALVLSVNPDLSPAEVTGIMAQTAKDRGAPGYDTDFGWGLVDAHAAVVAAQGTLERPCTGDLSGDGHVDGTDLAIVLGAWGDSGNPGIVGDADGNGQVNGSDIAVVLGGWGACP